MHMRPYASDGLHILMQMIAFKQKNGMRRTTVPFSPDYLKRRENKEKISMKKKTLSLFLVIVMCLTFMPTGVFAQDASSVQTPEQTATVIDSEQQEIPSGGGTENSISMDEGDIHSFNTYVSGNHEHCICGKEHKKIGDHTDSNMINFVAWSNANALPTKDDIDQSNSKYFYLTKSVEFTEEWQVPVDGMVICLNGHDIICKSSYKTDDVINVTKGYTFTITDCEGTGKISSNNTCRGVSLSGVKNVTTFDSDQVTTFNLYGGKICNNTTGDSGYGGGIYLNGYDTRTLFNMYGGEISNNTSGDGGGGILIYQYSKVNVYGGSISNNNSGGSGGGIYSSGYLSIKEKAVISGNTAKGNGGGIYNSFMKMSSSSTGQSTVPGECIIEDSKIINNTAYSGGGIYNASESDSTKRELSYVGSILSITGSEISGNTACADDKITRKVAGGGLYIAENDSIDHVKVINSKINNNTCVSNKRQTSSAEGHGGGGIYTAGNISIFNSDICGNIVKNDYGVGAGIQLCVRGLLSIIDSRINKNTGPGEGSKGGGIYCYGHYSIDNPARIYLKNTSVIENTVKGQGAGVYLDTVSVYADSNTAKDSLKLDGKITINNNTCGTDTKSNLLLKNRSESVKAVVTIGNDFNKNSSIGVGAEEKITPGTARDITDTYYTANYKDCFTSDNDNYEVLADEGDGAYKVQLKSPLPKYTITISCGEHANVVTDTTYIGKTIQNVEQGSAMETVKVVPENGYYFPTNDYSMNGTNVNGVKITQHTDGSKKNTGTWLEISGTPSADTNITLADPYEARKVSDLVAESYEYDGKAKAPALKSGKQDGDEITGNSYTNAGTYKMKVTSQTVFDNDSYEVEIDWTINKKVPRMSTISHGLLGDFKPVFKEEDKFEKIRETNDTYYTTPYSGSPKIVGIKLSDDVTGGGDITVWYKDYKNNGDYTNTPPTKVGVYRVAITMSEGANFKEITRNNIHDVIQFEIEGGYQAPPKGIVGIGPTTEGGNGYLSGTTTDMEYRAYYQDDVEAKGCKADKTEVNVYDDPDQNVYYIRYKATETLSPSDWVRIVVPKYKPPLTGTVTISGDVKYTSTLTANVTDANSSDLSYVWKRDGEVIDGATDKTYTLTLDDIGKTIFVDVTSSEKNGILLAKTSTTVAKLPMDSNVTNAIKAEGYTGNYDGKEHTITVTGVPEGAIVTYGTSFESCNESSAPKYKNVEVDNSGEIITRNVYFKVSIPGYEDHTGSAIVKINPVPVTIKINNVTKKVGSDDPEFTAAVTGVLEGETLNYTLRRSEADKDKNSDGDVVTIEADHTYNTNYDVKVEKGTLTITEKTPQNITFAENSITANPGDIITNALTGVHTAVTYASSNEYVATVDADGRVIVLKLGKTTITAKAESTADYTEAIASYELTVKAKVSMIDGGKDAAGAGSYDEKETVTIKAGTRSGYSFAGWTAEPEVTFADASSNETTFEMPAVNIKVTANWKRNSHSSGGTSTPKYTVSAPKSTIGGSVKSDVSNAASGSTVNVTVTVEEGYKLDGLKVTDSKGNEIRVTNKGNGKYTFTMPSDKVEITPVFTKEASEIVNELPFKDVAKGAYYYDAVKWAKDNGITGGVSNDMFGSNASCTRGHIVTFLWRNAGSPEPKSVSSLSDVVSNSYYAKAVAWAVENGITNGVGQNKFDPDAVCTRAQSVAFLYRAIGKQAGSKAQFSDVPSNSYYADAVAWAAANDVTNGIGSGLFGSGRNCTRSQIVTLLYRAQQAHA